MIHENPLSKPKRYSYKARKDTIRLNILDGMDSICESKGENYKRRAAYYDEYDFDMTDPEGSYTGVPTSPFGKVPIQDADDL